MKWRDVSPGYKSRLALLRRQTPRQVLQVPEGASLREVKAAYRRLVKLYHPDKSPEFMRSTNAELVKLINAAYAAMVKQYDAGT